ncbi:MAG: phosphodiester glycosidase family protein [Planctomycetota bacterium]
MTRLASTIVVVLCGVASAHDTPPGFDWPASIDWAPAFVGVEQTAVTLSVPRPLRLHAFRVDLAADGVGVCTDDSNGDRPEETDGCFTTTFLEAKRCQVAINGSPFWPGQKDEGGPQNVVGLVISEGELVSPFDAVKARSALVFRAEAGGGDLAEIIPPASDTAGVHTAIGAFGVVLRRGQPHRDLSTPADVLDGQHPRTAVGIADGGKTLILLVVDGRQPGDSEGVTLEELGELFRLLGASDAVNLDGGGTTAMAIEGPSGRATLVNQPIDGKVVGRQRVSASHLGVYADRLDR